MQLVLNTYGLQLSVRNRCFYIENKELSRIISPQRVSSILITKAANITSGAILLAPENNIPVVLVDAYGQPQVKITSSQSPGLTQLRRKQLIFSRSPASLSLVKQFLQQKAEGQINNLSFWANRKPAVQKTLQTAKENIIGIMHGLLAIQEEDALRGWEGSIARHYWQAVAQLVTNEGWAMKARSYRPAGDAFNAMLNYMYGMLYNQVETALTCAGLDSQIGIWHRDNYQTPSLAFDMIESLRPRVDRFLIEMVWDKIVSEDLCKKDGENGYLLEKNGRGTIIKAFNNCLEERIKMNGRVTAYKNHILQLAYYIKNHVEKDNNE